MKRFREFVEETLQAAAGIALANSGRLEFSVKTEDRNQVLTQTDIAIGKLITDKIQLSFPDFNIIDEELGCKDKGSEFTWVVDPIDGTSNFAAGLPHYGIMLGLLHGSTPVVGGIALPAFGETYLAEKGTGAWRNGERIEVTDETDLSMVLGAYGIDGHPETPERTFREIEQVQKVVLSVRNIRTSNSVYDQAMVAQGRYGFCINQTSKIWDNVAQQIVIEESGGIYTDVFGEPIDYSNALRRSQENFTWLAGPPTLHAQVLKVIHS